MNLVVLKYGPNHHGAFRREVDQALNDRAEKIRAELLAATKPSRGS